MNLINNLLASKNNNKPILFLLRKLARLNKIYFVPTKHKKLPKNNHPLIDLENKFEKQIIDYKKGKKNWNTNITKIIKKNFKNNNAFNLLDYGGENLDFYLYLLKFFPKIKITVINQVKLAKKLNRTVKKNNIKNIYVYSNFKKCEKTKFDFALFGSSLQYLIDYENILLKIIKNLNGYLFIGATSFFRDRIKNKNIIVKQVNLLPVVLFCIIFNYNYLIRFFTKRNLKLINVKKNSFKKINYKNFKLRIEYLDILLKKTNYVRQYK